MREPRINPLTRHLNNRHQPHHHRERGNSGNHPPRDLSNHPGKRTTTPVHGHPSRIRADKSDQNVTTTQTDTPDNNQSRTTHKQRKLYEHT